MKTIVRVWKDSIRVICKHPKVVMPFLVSSATNFLTLYILYLAPQRPVRYVLAPPIRKLWGEQFLHYPMNFVLLPKMFQYAEIAVSALIGIVMSAWAIGMIADIYQKGRSKMFHNFLYAVSRYFSLIAVWVASYIVATVVSKYLPVFFVGLKQIPLYWSITVAFVVLIIMQVLFIFVPPILIIDKSKLLPALKSNVVVLARLALPAIVLLLIPSLLYFPVLIVKMEIGTLMGKFSPEIALVVLAAGVVASFLVDTLVITSTTLLYVHTKNRKDKRR
jgi:hypothetical protein